jgi:type IV secretory pathway TrbD component
MTHPLSAVERLSERTLQMTSLEQFQIMRNLCLGGAAACLVVLGGLLQVSVKTGWEFNLSVWAAALSLPIWFTSSSIFETYVLIGPRSFPHFHFVKMRWTIIILMCLAGFLLWMAVGCVVAMLNFYAALGYAASTVIMVLVLRKVDKMRAEWWFSDAGPHHGDTGGYE